MDLINPIAVAIPGFFLLMGVEVGVAWRRGLLGGPRPIYRAVDALADLGCGIASQVTGLALQAGLYAAAYTGLYARTSLRFSDGIAVWIGTFVAYDLVYYLWHRASHRVGCMWAAHVVHHQSEDYNLAVALRQAMFTSLTSLPFFLPFALLGVSPLVFTTVAALNLLYQFWIHTRLVGRLGPLEWVLNTPSHHRVHHGINPRYIDRNHAGVFIVWDRLFGSFVAEDEEPTYGVVEGHSSANAVTANLTPWVKLARLSAQARGLDKVRVWFAPPEWRPAYLGGPVTVEEPEPHLRWNPRVPTGDVAHGILWLLLSSAALTTLLFFPDLPVPIRAGTGIAILWTIGGWGALHDGLAWARAAERVRLVVLPIAAATLDVRLAAGLVAASIVSLLLL